MSLLDRRAILLTSLLSVGLAASFAAGCAAPTDSDDASGAEEQIAESQDELTAAGAQLVGSYWTHTPTFGGFAALSLKANGKYTASVDASGRALCVTSPCVLPESGTWNAAKKAGGGLRLRIRAAGEASRWYDAARTGSAPVTLQLGRAGVSQTLTKLGSNECLDPTDCKATETCEPTVCAKLYCEANDSFCCGAPTCVPKAPVPPTPPTPPNACFGAWLDQFGGCRAPNDGGYPDSCCAALSTPCGTNRCGVGKVCCNELSGICANPGEVCAQ